MVSEQPVHPRGRVTVERDQCLPHEEVELAPAGLHEASVGGLLHEPVAKAVLGGGSTPLLDHELEPLELGEGRQQPRAGEEPLEQG